MTNPGPNLLLIGLRGSGKTTLGRALSAQSGQPFVDLDQRVLWSFPDCPTISDIFDVCGEPAFRRAEVEQLRPLIEHPAGTIIALGGGTPTAPGAEELLDEAVRGRRARIVYLRCTPDTLRARLTKQQAQDAAHRPPLTDEGSLDEIEAIFEARDPLYRSLATRIVVSADSIDGVVAQCADWMTW